MKGFLKAQRGFTLIELLVVIGILGLLAAVAIPTYTALFGAGKTEAHAAEKAAVQSGMDTVMQLAGVASVDAGGPANDLTYQPQKNNDDLHDGAGNLIGITPFAFRAGTVMNCRYVWDSYGTVTINRVNGKDDCSK